MVKSGYCSCNVSLPVSIFGSSQLPLSQAPGDQNSSGLKEYLHCVHEYTPLIHIIKIISLFFKKSKIKRKALSNTNEQLFSFPRSQLQIASCLKWEVGLLCPLALLCILIYGCSNVLNSRFIAMLI